MINLKKNKKGWVFPVFLVIITLVAFSSLLVIFSSNINSFEDSVGKFQIMILNTTFNAQDALFYLDKSVEFSYVESLIQLSKYGGYKNDSKCGKALGFVLWNCEEFKTHGSFPQKKDLENSLNYYFTLKLNPYLEKYNYAQFQKFNYHLYINEENELEGHSFTPLTFSSADDYLINYDSVQTEISKFDENNANKIFYETSYNFAKIFNGLTYQLGGISPYSYQEVLNLQKQNNPIFRGIQIPKGINPGFDCSGFIWWNLRHIGINIERTTAEMYYLKYAKEYGEVICDSNTKKKCTKEIIEKNAKNGDILFIDPCHDNLNRKICHIGIYKENSEIMHSRGSKGLVIEKIPSFYWPGAKHEIVAVYRYDFLEMKKDMPLISAEDEEAKYENIKQSNIKKDDLAFDYSTDYSYFNYLIDTNFKTKINYDFNFYTKLRKQSIELIDNCKLNEGIENCVDEKIITFNNENITWSRKCNANNEHLFYELYDKIKRCLLTTDDDCYCNISLQDIDFLNNEKIDFEIINYDENNKKNISFIDLNNNLNEIILKEYNLYYFDSNDKFDIKKENKYSLSFNEEGIFKKVINFFTKNKDLNFVSDSIYIFKKDGRFILADINYIEQLEANDLNECEIPFKNQFRFCVENKNHKFPNLNKIDNTINFKPLVYNFALNFFNEQKN
ncbi:MAG: C40 family peptidase [Nanoarchaeota archaeon]